MSAQSNDGTADQEPQDGGDSPVIQTLRQQLKEAKAEAKAAKDEKDQALADARAQVKREQAVTSLVSEAGFPKLTDVVLEKLEGEPTAEAVQAILEGFGLAAGSGSNQDTDSGSQKPDRAADLAGTANLGQQVAAAARGADTDSLTAKIAAATSPEEVAALMKASGLDG